MTKINIVGIGDDGLEGLTTPACQLVEKAELLVGTRETLSAATTTKAEKIEFGGDLDALVRKIEAAGNKRVVLLTAGDPMFYGTARYLCDRLGKDRFDVTPHVSSMQLAFARVKESWDDAYLTSLAAVPILAPGTASTVLVKLSASETLTQSKAVYAMILGPGVVVVLHGVDQFVPATVIPRHGLHGLSPTLDEAVEGFLPLLLVLGV